MQELHLENHRGRRSEPVGLPGLRKQVAEAEEGPLERERKAEEKHLEGRRGGRERRGRAPWL